MLHQIINQGYIQHYFYLRDESSHGSDYRFKNIIEGERIDYLNDNDSEKYLIKVLGHR